MEQNAELLGIYPMLKREVMTEKKKNKHFAQLYNKIPLRELVCINSKWT